MDADSSDSTVTPGRLPDGLSSCPCFYLGKKLMNLSANAQATLLLTSDFSRAAASEYKPLSNSEWGKFALWLKHQRISPAELLVPQPQEKLTGWSDPRISQERILGLLARGHSLALAVDKWQRAGLWILTRGDADYPVRLKNRLRTDAPPVLFGCGNKALLQAEGMAVVGSRDAPTDDLRYTQQLAAKLAQQGICVISGGARGIDECAMASALEVGGTAVGVLADSLLKTSTLVKWREGLIAGNLVLISPFYPEVRFTVGNAMARNKYIYCLAESAMVVRAGMTGGTITGAMEALKHQWLPMQVKPNQDMQSANSRLVENGASWSAEQAENVTIRLPDVPGLMYDRALRNAQPELFSLHEDDANYAVMPAHTPVDFYQLFVAELAILAKESISIERLASCTGLTIEQISVWLNRAEEEGRVIRLGEGHYQFR
ncbi:TPA: DNA-protecting protein DprA [Escherichia coli]|nr:DNA-protecting protein DprA [Escherichia coli]